MHVIMREIISRRKVRKNIEKKLIEIIAVTDIGDNILSINKMTQALHCSRGLLQNLLQEFEQKQYIKVSKTLSGTKLLAVDYNALAEIYFNSISISSALYTNSISDEKLTERVLTSLSQSPYKTYLTFSDSALNRMELLLNNEVDFALVSDAYYNSLDTNNITIYQKYNLKSTIHTKLIISDDSNLEYNIDEIPQLNSVDSSNVQTPTSYYLICLKHVANLIPHIIHEK